MIGVCLTTTPDREELFIETYKKWDALMPEDSILTYVLDEAGAGVAKAKNLSLSVLESLGVTEYFLSDDDTFPISKDWWKPFVESSEPHLLYNFKLVSKPSTDMQELYRDDKIVSYSHTRGCLIYVNKLVLDTVGGFDTRFMNSFEHPEYTRRIHNAGLTTHRSMSPVDCNKLIYCLDQDNAVESSIKIDPKTNLANSKLYQQTKYSKEYKEYK